MFKKCTLATLILISPHVFAQSPEIYDVTLNNNWNFSGLINFDTDNFYVPLRFLPSSLLGNIPEENFQDKSGTRVLVVPKQLASKIDEENLIITANLGEKFFKTQLIENDKAKLRQSKPINALFMNYDLNIPLQTPQDTRALFDFNWASKQNWRAKSGLAWDGATLVRLNTYWQKQFDDNSLLILGDTSGNSISGFNTLNFLGARYASSYYNSPAYVANSLPSIPISGFAVNPGRLDLLINNQIIQSTEINSGRYNINFPLQRQGYSLAQAIVYDVTGKPVVIDVPFYGNNEIIKAGAHAYDVSGGWIRKNLGTQSFDYESFVVNGLYKRGIVEGYTQDFFAQYSPLYSVASTLGHWVPHPKVGIVKAGYSYNSLGQSLYRVGLERSTALLTLGANIEKSKEFCFGFDQACIKSQAQLYTGFALPAKLGTLSANYISRETTRGKDNVVSMQYNKQITSDINFFTSISKSNIQSAPLFTLPSNITPNNGGLSVYMGLSINLGKGVFANSAFSKSPNNGSGFQQAVSVSERPGRPELGFGSLTFNQSDKERTLNMYYGARLRDFSYQINAYQDNRGLSLNGNVTGAVAYIPEENYITLNRQMQNGLAFVKVENLTDPAPIYHENKIAGYTDKQGRLLVPDVIALNNETINVDINKISRNITLENYKQEYSVPFSGAVRVDFKAKTLPYIVTIKGVKAGSIFNIGEDYYVVGENGQTSIDTNGKASVPFNGGTCELEFINTQKEYECK